MGRAWVGLLLFLVGVACDAPRSAGRASRAIRASDGPSVEALADFEELRCGACHAVEGLSVPPAASLEGVGARLRPGFLTAYLAGDELAGFAPHEPDLLAGRSAAEVGDLVQFLVSMGGPLEPASLAVDAGTLEHGRQLYHRTGCVACHEPFEEAANLERALWEFEDVVHPVGDAEASTMPVAAPRPFGDLRRKTSVSALADYLVDPLAVHPAGRMPSMRLTRSEADALAAYLFFEQAVDEGATLDEGSGLVFEAYETVFDGSDADFDALTPAREGVAADLSTLPEHREDDFGFRFRGFVTVPASGRYTFATTSDDGSWLSIDGWEVVDNRGQHPMHREAGEIALKKGRHAFELGYFEHLGGDGLEVTWSGPGLPEAPIPSTALSHWQGTLAAVPSAPFALDPARVERGRRLFEAASCQACHAGITDAPPARAPAFAEIAEGSAGEGCLADDGVPGVPRYSPGARAREAAFLAALRHGAAPSDEERLLSTMTRLDCFACHQRDGAGGPPAEKRPYFFVDTAADLGDEGRIPPFLDRVGGKLHEEWIEKIVVGGERVRPYMRTRMPLFGAANVGHLPALFHALDSRPDDDVEPEFSTEAVEAGQRLVGTGGLGCIQCHDFAGHPSLGIPAVDLAKVHDRIRPGWFRELLADPIALKMNTRMPSFMEDGLSPITDVYDGDPERQIGAIWSYLSLGDSMPYPEGLLPSEEEYELDPAAGPVSIGVFMKDVSPRTVMVGYPERTHVAFDVQNSRLAKAWRGRFFNARGTWHARAGALERPPTEDVLDFPPGAPFAVLAQPDDPWPDATGRDAGYRVLGRRYDEERRPIFRYAFEGVTIEEQPLPLIRAGGSWIQRRFAIRAPWGGPAPPTGRTRGIVFRAAIGDAIETREGGEIVVRGEPELRLRVTGSGWYTARRADGRVELRVPVELQAGVDTSSASLAVEVTW